MIEKHGRYGKSYFKSPKIDERGIKLKPSGKRKDGTEFAVEISLILLFSFRGYEESLFVFKDMQAWFKLTTTEQLH